MLKNYLKTAMRNLSRNKAYSLINILGLSIGLACAMLIMLYIKDEVSYDRFHNNVSSIYWDVNDDKMVADYVSQMTEMFRKAGFINIKVEDTKSPPGSDIHEMGGVRMGLDPATSLLNGHNQLHHCKNVFVTDGACMTSTGTQNPTLTFMALTARAVDYAVSELKKRTI